MDKIYIYGLIDPKLNLIKYVGATNDLNDRYSQHITPRVYDNTQKALWIKQLLQQNLKPYLILLDTVSPQNAIQSEVKWADMYKSNGLFNTFPIVPYNVKASKSEHISIRIDSNDIFKLKQIATIEETGYQAIIKRVIKEKIKTYDL